MSCSTNAQQPLGKFRQFAYECVASDAVPNGGSLIERFTTACRQGSSRDSRSFGGKKTTIRGNYVLLHRQAIVAVPTKARRRPVYRTSTPLTRLIAMAQPCFSVQKTARSRLCHSLKEFHQNPALHPSPLWCNGARVRGVSTAYSCTAAPRLRTDQCCSVTLVSPSLSSVVTWGTNSTALLTAKS
jgi:hypothetical protein